MDQIIFVITFIFFCMRLEAKDCCIVVFRSASVCKNTLSPCDSTSESDDYWHVTLFTLENYQTKSEICLAAIDVNISLSLEPELNIVRHMEGALWLRLPGIWRRRKINSVIYSARRGRTAGGPECDLSCFASKHFSSLPNFSCAS